MKLQYLEDVVQSNAEEEKEKLQQGFLSSIQINRVLKSKRGDEQALLLEEIPPFKLPHQLTAINSCQERLL